MFSFSSWLKLNLDFDKALGGLSRLKDELRGLALPLVNTLDLALPLSTLEEVDLRGDGARIPLPIVEDFRGDVNVFRAPPKVLDELFNGEVSVFTHPPRPPPIILDKNELLFTGDGGMVLNGDVVEKDEWRGIVADFSGVDEPRADRLEVECFSGVEQARGGTEEELLDFNTNFLIGLL
uniref:Uncharacterized protein n=1 Tax=Cacopsylla melanoneura TaxID=428564 RepID=A0A8D9E404_9HEMI